MTEGTEHFEDGPRLELDQLLVQLIARAQDVQSAHSRLRGLLTANEAIMGNLELPVVLREIVRVACELVQARYGALGVIGPDGMLEQFLHHGVDAQTVREIGQLPRGRGLLGAVIKDPHPIRLSNLSGDPRSVGFPTHHPAMGNFLGVPIRIREQVFGNLYLTERAGGDFTHEDEELVTALASSAAIAIENARLYEEGRSRQRWLQASAKVTQQLLTESGEDPLRLIARNVQELADADLVTVVLPSATRGQLMIEVATGMAADTLTAMSYPAAHTVAGAAIDAGQPILLDDIEGQSEYTIYAKEQVPIGAVMSLPLAGSSQPRGALLVARLTGRRRFSAADLEMATSFANHAAVALELTDARADQQRVALLEDRDRIARDLHDHVIQRLFAAGLTIQSLEATTTSAESRLRLEQVVTDLDDTIRQIRTSIFALRGSLSPTEPTLRAALLALVNEHRAQLGFAPAVRFSGAVDSAVTGSLVDDVIAVAREALSNIARHAGATSAELEVQVDANELLLTVDDNGVGIGTGDRRSGLENMRARAERNNGTFEVTSAYNEGTHLRWMIKIN